jgi:hypothetical protein
VAAPHPENPVHPVKKILSILSKKTSNQPAMSITSESVPPHERIAVRVELSLSHATHKRGELCDSIARAILRAAARGELPLLNLVHLVKVTDLELGIETSLPESD